MLGWYQTLHTLNFLRSRAADTDVQPCRNDFQNCFWAEYRLIGHTLNRQSTRHTTTLSIDSLDTLWTVSLHDIQLHWVWLIGHTLNRQSTRHTTTLSIDSLDTLWTDSLHDKQLHCKPLRNVPLYWSVTLTFHGGSLHFTYRQKQ